MNSTLIQSTFTYFAKFPLLAGVLKNFNKTTGTTGYNTLLAAITALTPNSLITNLNDYIFGADIISVAKRIEPLTGIYLYIDYGNIYDTLLEPMKTEQAEFTIAVTIARKTQPDDLDPVEQLLLSDTTLGMLTELKDIARADAKTNHFLKYLNFPTDITPWFAADLFNSVGWTMTFKIKGIHLI